jgi:hypothetical protein
MSSPARALVALLLAPACTAALADAPLVSETADVIGADACQIEASFARATASGAPPARGLDILGSCGVRGHSQAAIGYTHESSDGQTARSLRAFVKHTLVAPEAGRTGWGLRAGLNADRAPGESWRHEGVEVLGLMTREVAPGVLLHANLGHAWSRSTRQGTTLWSLGIETVADTTVAADLFADDRSKPWVSTGIGHKFGHGLSANASVAVQFDKPRTTQWTLGAKIEF